MGKHLRRKHSDVSIEGNYPGCMGGFFHILDYHQWHNLKNICTNKRHVGGRHARGAKGPKMNLVFSDTTSEEAQELLDAEVDTFAVEESMMESSATYKKFAKSRMKTLISDEMSKEIDRKLQVSAHRPRSRLLRTDSIHHLELTNHKFLGGKSWKGKSQSVDLSLRNASHLATSTLEPHPSKDIEEPVACINTVNYSGQNQLDELGSQLHKNHSFPPEKLEKERKALLKQKSKDSKELNGSFHQSKMLLDVLEIFNVDKDKIPKILPDPDSTLVNHFHARDVSNAKICLTKSMSFPVANSSRGRSFRSRKFKDKHKEIGSFTKGQLQSENSAPELLPAFQSSEEIDAQSMPLTAVENARGMIDQEMRQITDTSLGSTKELTNNRVVTKRFKDMRQRIKQAVRESRKERQRISKDAMLHRIPYGRRFPEGVKKEMADQCKEPAMNRDSKDKGGFYRIKRTSSLNDSLDRYAQLFESSFNRETKQNLSERLKLTNENGGSPRGHSPKSLGRILSLPDLGFYSSLQSEVFSDTLSSVMPKTFVDGNTATGSSIPFRQKPAYLPMIAEDCTQLDELVEIESQESLVDQVGSISDSNNETEAVGASDNLDNLLKGGSTSDHEGNIELISYADMKLAQPSPISVLDSFFREDITSPARVTVSFSEDFVAMEAGSELKPRCIQFEESDPMVNLHNQAYRDPPTGAVSATNLLEDREISMKNINSDFLHLKVDRRDEADFNYVKDVMELSGFCGNEYLGTWHSPDQPVDPSVFEEVEDCLPLELDCSANEAGISVDHQLLFDLINEALLKIYERSFSYWPRPLSSNSHIRPMPTTHHVLEEVWAGVNWYLYSRPNDQLLDNLVARDFTKCDGWMNLQFEIDCVGIELEELILDDLLEEVLCS